MALIQMNFLSNALKRTVPVTVILPVDYTALDKTSAFPTLYLLHGLLGSHTDWVHNTRIRQWAEARGLAVVMPSGDNSFYIDQMLPNQDYGEFIGRELVEMTRRSFPLSRDREHTFIAGLSMGGFGAIRNGLKYADTFGYIAGFSSAVHIFEMAPDAPGRTLFREDLVFGDLEEARKTDKNPRIALLRAKARALGITDIKQKEGDVLFTLHNLNLNAVGALCSDPDYKTRVTFLPNAKQPTLRLKLAAKADSLKQCKVFISRFAGYSSC